MGLLYILESAANTYVANSTNIMDGENFETDNWVRKVVRVGFVGSNAIGAKLTLKYGERRVATFLNTTSGDVAVVDADMQPVNSRLVNRAGEPIALEVDTASTTNPYAIVLDIKDIRPGRR